MCVCVCLNKAAFAWLMYWANQTIKVECTSSQLWKLFPRLFYLENIRTWQIFESSLWPRSHDMCTWPHDVPNDCECPHKHRRSSSACQVQTNHWNAASMNLTSQQTKRDNLRLVSRLGLSTVGGKRTSGQPLHKQTVPTTWGASTSDNFFVRNTPA